MTAATEKDIKELKQEYASLKSDLAEMSETLSSLARDGVAEGRERVRGAARQSRKQAEEAWDAMESEIEERPITSLAIALGIGFVLGKVLSR
ncbi:MAG: DUF883 family protein [Wenzhouxiangella sp.]|nr:MAG: DUF883 family protein [Wenzhouxiangella sp.]